MYKIIILFILPIFIILGLLAWACYPWRLTASAYTNDVIDLGTYKDNDDVRPSVLKIATWNTGFFYGEGSEGEGYELKDQSYFMERLIEASHQIIDWDIDVLFLQEIDFHSSRTHFINQAITLAKLSGYHYVALAPSWKANYIPFPYMPIKNHFGSMLSGGAILSKYPLYNHEIKLLDKPQSNPWWYNLFYLHRFIQTVDLGISEQRFRIANLHFEAFDKKNREDHIKELVSSHKLKEIDFIAGDFNMVPDSATQKTKFLNGDDYENDLSFTLMSDSGLDEVVPMSIYETNEKLYFTFPSSAPDRRLDYIFYKRGHKLMKAEVLPSALSDHLPLKAIFQIDSPRINPYSL